MVICKVCNNEYHYVSNTHVKKHNLTLKQYIEIYGSNIKSLEYKKKCYRNASATMSRLRREGVIVPGPMSLDRRKKNSEMMRFHNPMKNPETVRKVVLSKIGLKYPPRTLEQRLNSSIKKLGPLNPRWRGGGSITYKLWGGARKEALIRDNYTCQDCLMTNKQHVEKYKKGLHVHHKKPYRIYKEHNLDDLITLCVLCHIQAEKILARELKGVTI